MLKRPKKLRKDRIVAVRLVNLLTFKDIKSKGYTSLRDRRE